MAEMTINEAARKAALQTKAGRTLTGEDIRLRCEAMGVTPSVPSAWGGVIQSLTRSGVLMKTEETVRMRSPQARGRRSPVYTRLSTR